MPLTAPQAQVITAGAGLAGEAIGAYAQGRINKKTREYNDEVYARQRADSLADWNMQNEYNSPAEQMKRLKMAGLNPNLVYKNGATNEASPVRSTNAEGWNPRAPMFDLGKVANSALTAYLNVEMQKQQIDNLKAQNTVSTQEALLKAAQITNLSKDAASKDFDLMMKNELKQTSLDVAKAQLRKMNMETDVLLNRDEREAAMNSSNLQTAAENILTIRLNRAKTRSEINLIKQQIENLKKDNTLKELDINLKQNGVQPSDALWQRVLAQLIAQNGGIDLNSNPFYIGSDSMKAFYKDYYNQYFNNK